MDKPRLTVGFGHAQVRALLLIILIAGAGYGVWRAVRPSADGLTDATMATDASALDIQVTVSNNGDISINGQRAGITVRRLAGADELRLPVIDGKKDPTFIGYNFAITLDSPHPFSSSAKPIAYGVHGAELADSNATLTSDHQASWQVNSFQNGAEISLAASFPRGSFSLGPRALLFSLPYLVPLWGYILIGIAIALIAAWLMRRLNRHWAVGTALAQIDNPPSNLSPAAAGVLLDGRVGPRQLSAALISLAIKGDIQIVQTNKGYRLARRRPIDSLTPIERLLIEEMHLGLGPVSKEEQIREDLRQQLFNQRITDAYSSLVDEIRNRGLFGGDVKQARIWYRYWAVFLVIGSILGGLATTYFIPEGASIIPFWLGIFLSGWVVFTQAPNLPILTSVGLRERELWLGFRSYLSDTRPLPGGQANANTFLTYLPYAVSFGVVQEWLDRSTQGFLTIPDWYYNANNPGSTEMFLADILTISDKISSDLLRAALPE